MTSPGKKTEHPIPMTPRAKSLFGLAGVSGVFAILWFGEHAIAHRIAAREASVRWARFARCVVGDGPLGDERASARTRRIELAIEARRLAGAKGARDEGWPARCSSYAEELSRAWTEARSDDDRLASTEQIGSPLSVVGMQMRMGSALHDDITASTFDGLFRTAAELAPRPGDGDDAPPAPEPIPSPTRLREQLTPIYRDEGVLQELEPLAGRTLRATFLGKNDVCVFAAGPDPANALLTVRCFPMPPAILSAHGVHKMIGLEDDAPPMLSFTDWEDLDKGGVYAVSSGERLVAAGFVNEGAFGKKSGFVATLDRARLPPGGARFAPTYTLVRRLPDGRVARDTLDRPRARESEVFDALVVDGWMLWLEGPLAADHRIFAREVGEGDPPVGPVAEVGLLPHGLDLRTARVCRTPEALFVDLTGASEHALVVRAKGRWMPPLAPGKAGARFTCGGASATYTLIEPAGVRESDSHTEGPAEISQTRCSPERCESASTRLSPLTMSRADVEYHKMSATDLDGQVVLAWIHGAVFLRVAPLQALMHAPVRVVSDADRRHANGTQVSSLYLPAREDGVVLLLATSDGSFALRLDASGALTPLEGRALTSVPVLLRA
jgi:hypothetical protein